MNKPLLIAVVSALLGFGAWVWLTGPGTSVPNAFIALVCAIAAGRLGWWLATLGHKEEEASLPEGMPRRPTGRRAPPPTDATPWRKPESTD